MAPNSLKDAMINIQLLFAYGDTNKAIIERYNASISVAPVVTGSP